MNSIQNIVDKIINEANVFAREKDAAAQREAAEIIKAANEQAEKALANAKQQAEKESENQLERCRSSCETLINNAILGAKVEVLNRAFDEAALKLREITDEEFKSLMSSKIRGVFPNEDAVIIINSKRKAVAEDLKKAFEQAYSYKCEVKFDDSVFGMLVVFGDITADCTYDALIREKRASLEAQAAKLLFEE